jgi:hypothetical protein
MDSRDHIIVNNLGTTTNYAYTCDTTFKKTFVCAYCGKSFVSYKEQVNYFIKGSSSRKRMNFCSWTCKVRWKKANNYMEYNYTSNETEF